MMNNKRCMAWGIATLALVSLTGMGCGGSDNNPSVPTAMPYITRSTEESFSRSARILAARDAAANGETWLNADKARSFDNDLSVIQTAFPQVKNINALPNYDLRTIVVVARAGTPLAKSWSKGETVTGEPTLDALLAEFAPEKIEQLGATTESGSTYFTLRFGQSLNMVKLAERLRRSSSNITVSDPNYTIGDGDNILSTATRQYIFSRGWGDCPSGCINRHSWEFSVSEDGKAATLVKEDGTPLSAD